MVAISNLVHQTSSTTGTGNFTLASVNGKQSFNDAFGTGGSEAFFYFVSNRGAAEYEWGLGHMSDATTLVRDTVQGGTNGTSPVSFSAGTKDVTNALPVDEILRLDDYYTKSDVDTLLAGSTPDIAAIIHAATGKGTPVDADELGIVDSAASNVLKKLTWANLKATLKTYFDTLYQPLHGMLTAIAALSTTGLIVRTGGGAVDTRTLTAPAAGITVTNGNGVSGNPTLALANDLSALEGLSSTGLAARTTTDTWAQRTITGTTNHIAVTNGNGVSGDPTLDVGTSVALLDTAAQSLSGGARVVTYDNGTKSSGTFTPDPGNGPNQKAGNNGAHTLAPGTNYGSYFLDYTNGASAGAITTSGFTKVSGDSFTTTSGNKFKCHITVSEIGSTLNVQAMQ